MKTLKDITAGDTVIVEGSGYKKVALVTRTTATRIFIKFGKGELGFHRKNWYMVGGSSWYKDSIHAATDEEIMAIRMANKLISVARALQLVSLEALPIEELEKITTIANRAAPDQIKGLSFK